MPTPDPSPSAPTIYSRLRTVAIPLLRSYVTDLTEHDRRICGTLKVGDVAMYAVRPDGTHWVTYRNADDIGPAKAALTAIKAREYMEAIAFVAPGATWFLVECTSPQHGTVSPISFIDAFAIVIDTRKRMEMAVASQERRAA